MNFNLYCYHFLNLKLLNWGLFQNLFRVISFCFCHVSFASCADLIAINFIYFFYLSIIIADLLLFCRFFSHFIYFIMENFNFLILYPFLQYYLYFFLLCYFLLFNYPIFLRYFIFILILNLQVTFYWNYFLLFINLCLNFVDLTIFIIFLTNLIVLFVFIFLLILFTLIIILLMQSPSKIVNHFLFINL